MHGTSIGLFGKLPTHGDFIERRVAGDFREVWDEWLQRCIATSRSALGGAWLDCYLTSPMWRFFLSDGVAGGASHAGVLLPSVDRVGRYFPLTVVVKLPPATAPLEFAGAAAAWFGEVEQLCAQALQDENTDLAEFDRAIEASARLLENLDRLPEPPVFPGGAAHWRWPLHSLDAIGNALAAPLAATAQSALRPMTLWWTEGSERVPPSVLLVRSLPRPDAFTALLDGSWEGNGWEGETASADVLPVAVSQYVLRSAGATDTGTVRTQNQDAFVLNDHNRLWTVADGLGGHSQGEVASLMVVDALNNVEPTATLNAALQSVRTSLERVNADLRRAALGVGRGGLSGATVVALLVRGAEWGVTWAGDSRAYLLRAGTLTQLTRDHRPDAVVDERSPAGLLRGDSAVGEVTRAIGGDDELQLDNAVDRVSVGDRFLLCSDGLYTVLDPPALIEGLGPREAAAASRLLIEMARAAGAPDNVTAVVVDVLDGAA